MPQRVGKRTSRERIEGGWLARFGRDERGVTAVEMALVAGPFLFGLLAIFEVALTFLGGQTLQMAVDNTARQIRTGEARTNTLATRAGFVEAVCREALILHDCEAKLRVDIRSYPTFRHLTSAPPDPPLKPNGEYKDDLPFTVGQRQLDHRGAGVLQARADHAALQRLSGRADGRLGHAVLRPRLPERALRMSQRSSFRPTSWRAHVARPRVAQPEAPATESCAASSPTGGAWRRSSSA